MPEDEFDGSLLCKKARKDRKGQAAKISMLNMENTLSTQNSLNMQNLLNMQNILSIQNIQNILNMKNILNILMSVSPLKIMMS